MKELFLNILTASLHGSVIIGVILLLRPVLKKAPKNIICLLWLLAALRLLLPFEIQSSLSLQPDLEGINLPVAEYVEQITSGFHASTQDVILPPVEWEDVPVQTPDTEITQQPVEDTVIYEVDVPLKVKILENYEQILILLWATGAAGLLIYSLIAYTLLKGKVRNSVIYADGVWVCGSLESAFVLGFFRPQIYLSAALTENDRRYVLLHERTHIHRGDHWWKLVGFLTLAIHWFNPLVWLGYSLLCRDLEMACDEAVIRAMNPQERKSYSAALLNCSVHTVRIAACPVAFGEVSVKQRIKNVLHYRKPAFWITIVALVLVAVVAVCFLTSPENAPDLSFLNYENAISTVADQDQVMTIYCDEDSIIPCQVDGLALAKYLDNANWKQRRWEPGDQSSPGSIEFVISDDYRITVFDRNFARVKYNGDTRYYRTSRSDYERALELIDDAKYAKLTWNLEVKAADVTPSGLTFMFIQHGPFAEGDRANLMYGSEYTLQVRNGQSWEEVPIMPQDYEIAWTTEAYLIEVGKTYQQKIDWQWLYGTLSAGEYRIGKTVSLNRAPGDSETHTFWTEFTIPEEDRAELIQRCRDAMITLKNSEELYMYITNLDDPNAVQNVLMRAKNGWLFQYRRPQWDYEYISWLCIGDKQYIYDGDRDSDGMTTAPYYWQIDPSPMSHDFPNLYPLNLDWNSIELVWQNSSAGNGEEVIQVLYPEDGSIFTLHFAGDGTLMYYDSGDNSGEAESTTLRCYVKFPWDGTIEDYLTAFYEEIVTVLGNKPQTPDNAFYKELLNRKTDGHATEKWVYDLYITFYTDPETFLNQLSQIPQDRREDILTRMSYSVYAYAPARFENVLWSLEKAQNPNMDLISRMHAFTPLDNGAEMESSGNQPDRDPDNDALLKKCQDALESQQAKDYFQIMDNVFFSTDAGANYSGSTLWYVYKDTFLCQSQSEGLPEAGQWWNLYCDGSYYHRKAHTSTGPQFGLSWESDWGNGQFNASPLPSTLWPLEFDFTTANITHMEAYADEYGESITIAVSGDPLLQNGAYQPYIVIFHLNTHGVLQRVQMQYLYGDAQVERILVFRTTTREEVMDMIEQCHDEALLHTRGICKDPACTDKAHDHSGVNCTDDHCDNPIHHHSSHH